MDSKGFATIADVRGKSLPRISEFKNFDLSFRAVARIDPALCIRCDLCYVACNDTAHQCIDLIAPDGRVVEPHSYDIQSNGKHQAVAMRPQPVVRESDCVGCRLCYNVCPVDHCIEMVELPPLQKPVTWEEISRTRPEVTEDWQAMEKYRKDFGIEIH
jgi:dihydropyrimidine dehydrogenase (NAD+) subunit PreA